MVKGLVHWSCVWSVFVSISHMPPSPSFVGNQDFSGAVRAQTVCPSYIILDLLYPSPYPSRLYIHSTSNHTINPLSSAIHFEYIGYNRHNPPWLTTSTPPALRTFPLAHRLPFPTALLHRKGPLLLQIAPSPLPLPSSRTTTPQSSSAVTSPAQLASVVQHQTFLNTTTS